MTLQGNRQVERDEDDFNTAGRKSRRKRAQREKVHLLYSGRQAAELYLQCYQLILWKQCHWLCSPEGAGLPPELETVIRDLWALRLHKLQVLGGADDDHGGAASSAGGFSSAGFSSTGLSSTEEWTATDTDGASAISRSSRRRRRLKMGKEYPRLVETLALCYLGMVLMRLPVSIGEIQGWAEREEVVYIRAVSHTFCCVLNVSSVILIRPCYSSELINSPLSCS